MYLSEIQKEEVLNFKNELHKHPEVSNHEFETTRRIKEELSKLDGVEILDIKSKTGVVAIIKSKSKGINVGLRCDIDAINQTEEYLSEYKSQNPGVMHACGHDSHAAALLGAAKILSSNIDKLNGDVLLLFQKSEETTTGAREMIRDGIFDELVPDYFYSIHNWPSIESGKISCNLGNLMASKVNFKIKIIGKGGHGSNPHLNIDPIVCAADFVSSVQTVASRNIDPMNPFVLSINYINGGSIDNLVFEDVVLTGTIRSLDENMTIYGKKRVETLLKNICNGYECRWEIEFEEIVPSLINSEILYNIASKTAADIVGKENVISTNPTMASEDFSYISKIIPSFMYWVGSAKDLENQQPLHSKNFTVTNESVIISAELLAQSVFNTQRTVNNF